MAGKGYATATIKALIIILFMAVVIAEFSGGIDLSALSLPLKMHDLRPALLAIMLLYVLLIIMTSPRLKGFRRGLKRFKMLVIIGLLLATFPLALKAYFMHSRLNASTVRKAESYDAGRAQRQVLFVGLDGATFKVIDPLVREGKLPNIEKLIEEGVCGELRSIESYRPSVDKVGIWSPSVWTSIATGKLPRRHGITDFTLPDRMNPKKQTIAGSYHRRGKALWNILSDFKIPTAIVGWWATWPAERIHGIMVSSHMGLRGLPERRLSAEGLAEQASLWRLTYPEDYIEHVREDVPLPADTHGFIKSRFFDIDKCKAREPFRLNTFRSVCFQDRYYAAIARHLLETERPRFLYVYLEGPDVASHLFWEFMVKGDQDLSRARGCDPERLREVVRNYYIYCDEVVGDLVRAAEQDATVIIASDHGFKSDPGNKHFSNHAIDGIFIFRGPDLRKDCRIRYRPYLKKLDLQRSQAMIMDLLPTILYIYGAPVAKDFDGRVLTEVFEREFLKRNPIRWIKSYDSLDLELVSSREAIPEIDGYRSPKAASPQREIPEIDKEFEERLKSLQYVDDDESPKAAAPQQEIPEIDKEFEERLKSLQYVE